MLEITVTHRFEAMHCWPTAPSSVVFLRSMHRHLFHVSVTQRVTCVDRDVEFFDLQRKVADYIATHLAGTATNKSCEQMALDICRHFRAECVSVSEDGENAAIVTASVLPVADMARTLPFVGTEIEGPWASEDITGLYIPCTVAAAEYVDKHADQLQRIVEQRKVGLVYVGAGNLRITLHRMPIFAQLCAVLQPIICKPSIQLIVELEDSCVCPDVANIVPDAITVARTQHALIGGEDVVLGASRLLNYIKWVDGDNIVWLDIAARRRHIAWLRDPLFDADTPVSQFSEKE